MPGFNFRRREDAEKLLGLIKNDPNKQKPEFGVANRETITTGWLFRTPAGGIPAATATRPGAADCTPLYIDSAGNFQELKNNAGQSQTIEIKNVFSDAVGSEVRITVKEIFGVLCADAEDCGTGQYSETPAAAPASAPASLSYGGDGETI